MALCEIIWHGRGGQGAFTAARLLGAARALKENGGFALAFPSFGPERRGAPVRAFTKLSEKPIGDRSESLKADFIVYLDDTLFDAGEEARAAASLKSGGLVLVCSKKQYSSKHILAFDGVSLAEEILHLDITNTVMLGALAAVCPGIAFEDLENAVRTLMPKKLQERNLLVIKRALEAVSAKREENGGAQA